MSQPQKWLTMVLLFTIVIDCIRWKSTKTSRDIPWKIFTGPEGLDYVKGICLLTQTESCMVEK